MDEVVTTIITTQLSGEEFLKSLSIVLPVIVTVYLTYRGWRKDREKDRENTRDNMRLQYLFDAYILLASYVQRDPKQEENRQYIHNVEKAADLINLFGTKEEIKKFREFTSEFSAKNQGSMDNLLEILRNRLRKELKLENIDEPICWFRIKGGVVGPNSAPVEK